MATVITTPTMQPASDASTGVGIVLGTILALGAAVLLIVYVLPAFRGVDQTQSSGTTQLEGSINVPQAP